MTIHLAFGWWLVPLAITFVAFVWASRTANEPHGYFGEGGFWNLFIWMVALIPTLIAWLVWAVLT